MSYPTGALEHKTKREDFYAKRIGKTQYILYYLKDIAMTGSNVTKRFSIHQPHRILNLKLFHGDSNKDANTDNLEATLKIGKNSIGNFPDVEDILHENLIIDKAQYTYVFDENEAGIFQNSVYQLILNTTNGHYVTARLVVQIIGRMTT